ncbi:hypothetical protein P3W45_000363 [Vairimorpha bombi]|jgi:long-chain acyl-CoA synthetase
MEKRTNKNKNGEITHKNYIEDLECTENGSKTLIELFLSTVSKYPNKEFLGTIKNDQLHWESYSEIRSKVEKISSFFNSIIDEKNIIGIFSVNRYEWLVSEYASYMSNCLNCPLYSTFGPEAVKLIIEETQMKICCLSGIKAESLLDILKDQERTSLKHVVIFDEEFDRENEFKDIGIEVYFFNKIIEAANVSQRKFNLSSNDLATICYTSGTSGIPKGVQLTHKNFIANVAAFFRGNTKSEMYNVNSDDVYMSYLPLAHVMERISVSVIMSVGGSIGFFRGNPKEIKKDYMIIRPTFIIAVPRVLNLFKQKIEEGVASRGFLANLVFNLALKWKIWRQKRGCIKNYLLDFFIFDKIANEFGGRIRACLCGSASLSPDVLVFLQGAMSMRIFQGYGQTETTGATTLCPLDVYDFDNVGIPFPSCKIKLLPTEGYDESTGQILVKGDNVTQGYFKRPELNDELFTEDGWLKTGDIGSIKDGVLRIEGRTKDRFKTGHGEYIEPEKLELLFVGGIIEDILITSLSGCDKLVAIVVSTKDDVTEKDVLDAIFSKGNNLVRDKKMNRYEIPSHIILLKKGFEAYENQNFLSPTAKKIRKNIEKYFNKEIKKALKKN